MKNKYVKSASIRYCATERIEGCRQRAARRHVARTCCNGSDRCGRQEARAHVRARKTACAAFDSVSIIGNDLSYILHYNDVGFRGSGNVGSTPSRRHALPARRG